MRQKQQVLEIATRGQGFYEFSRQAHALVHEAGFNTGLLTVYCRHTSCSLLIQENADPDVRTDMSGFFHRLVPENMDWLLHTLEGPDDMPAHIKTALTQTSVGIPIADGHLVTGTWQGIYLFEHRSHPHTREIVLHLMGE